MAVELLAFIPGILILIFANYAEKNKHLRILTQAFLGLLILLILIEGLAVVLLSGSDALEIFDSPENYAIGMVITAMVAAMIFLRRLREELAKVTNIDPDNWLHATALVFAVTVVGMSLSAAMSADVLELGGSAGISTLSIIIQDTAFVFAGFFGVGWLVRRDFKGALKRLGLVKPGLRDISLSVAFTAVLLVMIVAITLISYLLDPNVPAEEDPTIALLGGVTILTAIIYSVGAGVGEEIIFRGALQPRFGIILTSVIFAFVHIQYFDVVSMATLFVISVILGYERKILNTTACIITHTLYDLVLFLALV